MNAQQTLEFVLSPKTRTGAATFTVKSERTGKHFTYRVAGGGDKPFFVRVLCGPEQYRYLGTVFDGERLVPSRKHNVTREAPSFQALDFVLRCALSGAEFPPALSVMHEGRCGRCGRELTHPESIESGIGPVCATK